jgi:hypothetical protein
MSRGDQLIERGASRLEELSRKAAAKGGVSAKFADELAEDAVFLRQLKPSLIAARAKGRAPKNQSPSGPPPAAPTTPQLLDERPKPKPKPDGKPKAKKRKGGGPNPFLVAGVALAAGILLAKAVDWRSHAHPRD